MCRIFSLSTFLSSLTPSTGKRFEETPATSKLLTHTVMGATGYITLGLLAGGPHDPVFDRPPGTSEWMDRHGSKLGHRNSSAIVRHYQWGVGLILKIKQKERSARKTLPSFPYYSSPHKELELHPCRASYQALCPIVKTLPRRKLNNPSNLKMTETCGLSD